MELHEKEDNGNYLVGTVTISSDEYSDLVDLRARENLLHRFIMDKLDNAVNSDFLSVDTLSIDCKDLCFYLCYMTEYNKKLAKDNERKEEKKKNLDAIIKKERKE